MMSQLRITAPVMKVTRAVILVNDVFLLDKNFRQIAPHVIELGDFNIFGITAMKQHAIAESYRFTIRNGVGGCIAGIEAGGGEGVSGEQAVVAHVPAGGEVGVLGMIENGDA